MIAGGLALVLFFIAFKILRDRKLWIFKNSTFKDITLVNEEKTDKEIIRNASILGAVLVVMVILITVFFNIW